MHDHHSFPPTPDCPVLRTPPDRPDEAEALRRRARGGELQRIAYGRYCDARQWHRLLPEQRHHVLVRSLVDRIVPEYAVSHRSAAVLLGVPVLGTLPDRVQLIRRGRRSRTTNATFVVHDDLDPESRDILRFTADGLLVTGFERTAVDLATTMPFLDAVVALDRVLASGVDRDAIGHGVDRRSSRGRRRARRSLAFADAASGSVGESVLRVRFDEYGTPPPVLQHRFSERGHPDIVVDFWFPEQGIVVEFDGEAKYRDPQLRGSRTAEDVVVAEKYREDRLRAFPDVTGVVRVGWVDLWREVELRSKLRRGRVPMTR
ncbi:hypothetical protein [Curtobacterium luteum]|uniref:hypothetical protein n=1 Tax=Curtobacterium luteum TaxID=33881 RepID=UPI00380668EC